jgi:ribonuclease P protein component
VVRTDAPTDGDQTVPERAQVAYAVGKGVGGAVVRNRVRRRLRPLIDQLERDGLLVPGLYLVGVTASAPGSSFADLREHLFRAVADASAPALAGAR